MPTYIKGPAIVKRGAATFFFDDGLTVNVERATSQSKSDLHGVLKNFVNSTKTTISGKPAPLIENLSGWFGLGVADVGTSIFTASDVPLEIWSKTEGKKFTWKRSGIMKAPGVLLSATKDIFDGQMQWVCLGERATAGTTSSHWKAEAVQAFSATFDATLNQRYRYTAAYGGDSDFAAMTAQDGFKLAINYAVTEIPDDNVGIGDIDLQSITAEVRFIPSNLTEAKIHELIRLQDADALLPGDTVGGENGEDLVISGTNGTTGFDATLFGVGFTNSALQYATGKLRAGEIVGLVSRTFSAGTPQPLWEFATTTP